MHKWSGHTRSGRTIYTITNGLVGPLMFIACSPRPSMPIQKWSRLDINSSPPFCCTLAIFSGVNLLIGLITTYFSAPTNLYIFPLTQSLPLLDNSSIMSRNTHRDLGIILSTGLSWKITTITFHPKLIEHLDYLDIHSADLSIFLLSEPCI